jgi:DNA-binding MarR family transcriptional regulator
MADVAEQINDIWTRLGSSVFAIARPDDVVTLSNNQLFVLYVLRDSVDMRISDLAEKVGTSVPALSRTLKSLEARGYVTRRVDERDRRASLISLATAGTKLVNEHRARVTGGLRELLSKLSKRDQSRVLGHFADLEGLLLGDAEES